MSPPTSPEENPQANSAGAPCDGTEPLVMHVRVVSGTGGGPDKTILNSPRFLKELGYRCVCVYLRDPRDDGFSVLEKRAESRQAPLLAVDDFGLKDWEIVRRLAKIIEQHRPLIWHGHDYKSNLLGLVLRRRYPMQMVTTVHGWVERTWKTPIFYFVDRQCLRRYDKVVCVSNDLFQDCLRIGVRERDLCVIDNAIALDDYQLDLSRENAKRKLGVDPESQLVLGVGRLSDEKGFDLLIQAVSNLISSGLNVSLAIAGDGKERERLQDLIDRGGHQDRIQLLGFVADPRMVYRAADLYALSSRREGLPNVVLEAMAMELPVLATNVAGMPSLITEDVNGRMIEPNSLDALITSLHGFLNDSDARKRIAKAGRLTVEERYNFQNRMKKMVDVYRSLEA